MSTAEKPVKLTVSLEDRELYRALRHAAVERDQPMKAIVVEALREWLRRQEEAEDAADLALMREALVESDERIPYDQIRREMGLA